jgi:hypothetical protein
MEALQQFDDGTLAIVNAADALKDLHIGGPALPVATAPRYSVERVAKMALAAVDTAGGALSWQNTTGRDVMVTRALLNVTTKSTGAGTISVGQTATNGTTSSANLLDTLDVGTAAGLFSNLKNPGTLGKADQLVASGKWVTGSKASGGLAGLVGYAYICYVPV